MNKFTRFVALVSLVLGLLGASAPAQAEDLFLPDLTFTTKQDVTFNGQEFYQIFVKNNGLGHAGAYSVTSKGVGGHLNNTTFRSLGLAPGEEDVFIQSTGFTTSCDWWRQIIIDSDKQVTEVFEDNNMNWIQDQYCPRPDVQLTTETVNPNGHLNEYQRITITNKGTKEATNYVLTITSSGGGITSAEHTIAKLAPGSSVSYNFFPMAGCNYEVKAKVKGPMYDDYNNTNNLATVGDSCAQ